MVYITGDTHGEMLEWLQGIEPLLRPGDTLLVAGDGGLGMWHGPLSEELFYDRIAASPWTVLFVDGNHEHFDRLRSYPTEVWQGGRVHRIRNNLLHLMRGECFRIEDHRVFVFGGGYSLDRAMRKPGVSWWPEELPSEAEYENAEETLRRMDYQADFIITHTAPLQTVEENLARYYGIRRLEEDRRLTAFLETVRQRVPYRRWYFGHYHIDAELWRGQTALLHAVRELESGRIAGWKAAPNSPLD